MNMNDLTNWVNAEDAFLADGYGVVVLANNPKLLLRALPDARVGHLDGGRRQERYGRDNFPALALQPWASTNLGPLVLFNHESSPRLLFFQNIPLEGLRLYLPQKFPEFLALERDRRWYFALLASSGGSLILLAAASLQYVRQIRRASQNLIRQKNLLMEAEHIARLGSWICQLESGKLELSEHAAEILSHPPAAPAATYDFFAQVAATGDRDRVKKALATSVHDAVPCNLEFALSAPAPGRIVHLQGRLIRHRDGRTTALVGTIQDITERKLAEQALQQSVSLLTATLESTADGIIVVDQSRKITNYNQRFLQLWHLSEEALAERDSQRLMELVTGQLKHPEQFAARVSELYGDPAAASFEMLEFKDGRIFERYSKPQLVEGQPVGRVWSFRDVTERKRAEASLLETDRRLRTLIDATLDIIFLKDGEGRWLLINEAARADLALGEVDYQGKTEADLSVLIPRRKPEWETGLQADRQTWERRKPARFEEYLRHRDGQLHCYDLLRVPIFNADGTRQGLVVVGRDITERKRTEEELFKSRETLRMVLNNIPQRVFWKNREMIFQGCNLPMARDCGFNDPAELIGKSDFEIASPANAERYRAADREVMDADQPKLNYELTETRPDGSTACFLVKKVPLHDQEGRVIGVLGAYEDITERRQLEAQFRQAQKMEAIGRLAGGVAHDFNNLLTVICGYSEILLGETERGSPAWDSLTEIRKAGQRAAGLTRQLLAFSRKQVLEPDILDLNEVVRDCENMFARLLGEDIDLQVSLAANLGKIRADSSQIDQVLLNLVVNARDAMPRGGKLVIETANATLDEACTRLHEEVKAGKYVSITVSDTGCGMDEQTLAHIFEPFFTTKDQGKGTGLGLAMVFGFIKQSGGHIAVISEPNQGSTFKIYLPEFEEIPAE
jgi:PAS domain S-box-containing protein